MSQLQAVLFNRYDWTISKIRKFLERNKMTPIKPIHTTVNYYRVRLIEPKKRSHEFRLITLQMKPEVKAVVMWRK
jgi:hypothetical protein